MFIGSQSGEKCRIQVKDLKIVEDQPLKQPYNVIPIGEKVTKTTYIFVEPWKNHHDFMVSFAVSPCRRMGFKGSG